MYKLIFFIVLVSLLCLCYIKYREYKNQVDFLIKFSELKDNFSDVDEKLNDIEIVYISLEREKKRLKKIKKELLLFNVKNSKIFNAIDKNNIKNNKHGELQNIKFINENKKNTLGELACTLSHLSVIKDFYENSKDEHILILEDDSSFAFAPYWKKSINQLIKEFPEDGEILYLTYHIDEKDFYLADKIVPIGIKLHSAAAYIINKKGAKKIVEKYYKNGRFLLEKTPDDNIRIDNEILPILKRYYIPTPYFLCFDPILDSTLKPWESTFMNKNYLNKVLDHYVKLSH